MATTNRPTVQRSEAFFRYHNGKSHRLRSKHAIRNALSVLPISNNEIDRIFLSAKSLWSLHSGTSSNFHTGTVKNTPKGIAAWATAAARLRTAHPGFFQMTYLGPEEEKFVHQKVAEILIWFTNEANRPRRDHTSRALEVDHAKEMETNEEDASKEMETDEENASEEMETNEEDASEETDDEEETSRNRKRESSTASESSQETTSATNSIAKPKPAVAKAPKASIRFSVPSISIEVWSARYARPLFRRDLKDVIAAGDTGHVPSFAILEAHARSTMPPNIPFPNLNGHLQFVQVMADDTNTTFDCQEVLQMEWEDWRESNPGGRGNKTFYLWAYDCYESLVAIGAQPEGRMSYPGKYGMLRFVKLPLKF